MSQVDILKNEKFNDAQRHIICLQVCTYNPRVHQRGEQKLYKCMYVIRIHRRMLRILYYDLNHQNQSAAENVKAEEIAPNYLRKKALMLQGHINAHIKRYSVYLATQTRKNNWQKVQGEENYPGRNKFIEWMRIKNFPTVKLFSKLRENEMREFTIRQPSS